MSPSPSRLNSPTLPGAIRRELTVLVAALAFGVLLMPPLLWLVGAHALGPYADGGMGDLTANFFRGLASGTFAFWAIALAPYLIALVARGLVGLARHSPAAH